MKKLLLALATVAMATALGCSGSDGADGTSGNNGTDGVAGDSCAVADNGDGTVTITCEDGTTVTVADGSNGTDGDSCTVADNGDGTKTITCDDGTTVTVGDGVDAVAGAPGLEGHDGSHGYVLPYDVQAAYNDDTMFIRVTYRGNEGKRHQYLRYTGGSWKKEGGDRRDAQASMDGDAEQGDTNLLSTIYEQRTSIMWNDPAATSNAKNFEKFGCFLTCHDDSRHMPEWHSDNGHDGKWIPPSQVSDNGVDSDKILDLWHWRGARSNPIAMADDQYIRMLDWAGSTTSEDDGGRKGDDGTSVYRNQGLDGSGNPEMLLDPATTWGNFTFSWDNFWKTPFYYMVDANAASLGATAPNPVQLPYADAVTAGYVPAEGDTVPRRILRAGAGSRADITAFGTTFKPESPDGSLGVWRVQMQRKLDTTHDDDVLLVDGNTYDVGFEVHLWEYTTRDHYISFPTKLSLGPTALAGDIEAVKLSGAGSFPLPEWDNQTLFPTTRLYLFQPGINSWEFLSGQDTAKTFTDPVTGNAVGQTHGGASAVSGGTTACTGCHVVRQVDGANSMELLTRKRGGIWSDTPTD